MLGVDDMDAPVVTKMYFRVLISLICVYFDVAFLAFLLR